MSGLVLDLFAGPGGWSEGLRMLGHHERGIENDEPTCATARAAGHERVLADVASLNPADFAPVWGLIASPPCQAWSMAGKGGGRRDVEHVVACSMELAAGADTREQHAAKCEDARSMLVVEPLRWALALQPTWIALEQVPPVLELWTLYAQILEAKGWHTWAGVLEAERYGVPQTRERAILLAHQDRTIAPPEATHQRYVAGEPQRHDVTMFGEILPWVSMAEALGWGMTARPYPTVACSSTTGGPDLEKVGGSAGRKVVYDEQEAGRWLVNTGRDWKEGGSRDDAQQFDAQDRPAPAIDGKGRWHVQYRRGGDRLEESTPIDAPAPTVTSRADRWQVKPEDVELRVTNDRPNATRRTGDEPAPTLAFGHERPVWLTDEDMQGTLWAHERPATTVAGDSRVFPPGHKVNAEDIAAGRGGQRRSGSGAVVAHNRKRSEATAIRVSIEEAGVLQSFPADYPWQGNKSDQFRQVGNAIPPLLARAVLGVLV